ncbi:PREDICTED: G-protein coupled receptor 54-like [Branchiostoma belcheri]|uniref:G-protein coupled receptor 54-like n=1 Tax=Branchiostoma belcheri TaxID=7741 RepID=A0A6P4ZM32_BRABE|nr:PREDICTED: G-protein coupled receptor 54-like [Branchiostoma belcheri]
MLFTIIGVVGISANTLVIYIITKYNEMKTPTNHYIVSLAVADLSFLIFCSPFTAYMFATTSWTLGRNMCKFVFYVMQVTVDASCFSMTSLSVDRYFAIVHPIASINFRTPRSAVVISAVIWTVALLISSPLAVNFDLVYVEWHSQNTYCMERWSSLYGQMAYWISIMVVTYVLPLAVASWSCMRVVQQLWGSNAVYPGIEQLPFQFRQKALRKKRKVCLMIVAMALMFAICWLPNHVIILWQVLDPKGFPRDFSMHSVKIFAVTLTYLQSALNPILYVFLGEAFRKNLRKECPCMFRSGRVGSNREAGTGAGTGVRPSAASRPLELGAPACSPARLSGHQQPVVPANPNRIDLELRPISHSTNRPSSPVSSSSKQRPLVMPKASTSMFIRRRGSCCNPAINLKMARVQPAIVTSKV